MFLPGKSHGRRSLVGYSLWGRRVGHDWASMQDWRRYTNALMRSGQQNFLVLFTLPVASSADTDLQGPPVVTRCPLPLPQAQIKRIQIPRGTMNNPAKSDISHSTFQSVHSTKHRGKAFWESRCMFMSFLWDSWVASKGWCAHPEGCEGWMMCLCK